MPSGAADAPSLGMSTVDRQGRRLCDATGCRKRKGLQYVHRGWFCHRHRAEMAKLRDRVSHCAPDAMDPRELRRQYEARTREMLDRKVFDAGHVVYVRELERRLVGWPARRDPLQATRP